MKRSISYLLVAMILGGVATAALTASRIDRQVARAQQQLATLELEAPEATFAELASYLDFAETMPWLFGETRAELDICSNDRTTHIHSERLAKRYLIGDRFVVIGLLGRANPRVNHDLFSVQPIHLDDPHSHLTFSNSAAISAPMS